MVGGAMHSSNGQSRLASSARIVERPFVSNVPIVGPWIVRLRVVWNWMSTTWYVRPLIEQQNAFNAAVVDSLGDLQRLSQENLAGIRELRVMIDRLDVCLQATGQAATAADRSGTRLNREVASLQLRLQRLEAQLGVATTDALAGDEEPARHSW
jgi:hypothetical protein